MYFTHSYPIALEPTPRASINPYPANVEYMVSS